MEPTKLYEVKEHIENLDHYEAYLLRLKKLSREVENIINKRNKWNAIIVVTAALITAINIAIIYFK